MPSKWESPGFSHGEEVNLTDGVQRRDDHDAGLLYLISAVTAIGAILVAAVGPPRVPTAAPHLPTGAELELLLRTPTAAQLDGALLGFGWLAWLLWAVCVWVVFTALFRAAVLLGERAGAAWLRPAHRLSDVLTFPAVRRAVDGVLAGLLVARVVTSSAAPPLAFAASAPTAAEVIVADDVSVHSPVASQPEPTEHAAQAEVGPRDVLYKVQRGDSVGRLAAHFYGDWQAYPRIVAANRDRVQPDGRSLGETGTIHPDWTLVIPEPTHGVRIDEDGNRWYTVERGDTLWGISDELLGDGRRWPEVFALNREQARLDDRHVLRDPNLIWPKLKVKLPHDDRLPAAASTAPAANIEPSSPELPATQPQPLAIDAPIPAPAATGPARPTPPPPTGLPAVARQDAAMEQPSAAPAPSTPEPAARPGPVSAAPPAGASASAPLAAAAAGGLAAAAIVGGALVVRRRRPAPDLRQPESDVAVEGGYAELDPAQVAAQRLLGGGGGDLTGVVAGRLAQAYAHHLDGYLAAEERAPLAEVRLLATRHGRTSTTLVLAAPLAARPPLLRQLPTAAELAFGEQVDVEGLVSHEGDVLIRLTGVARQAAHLRAAATADGQRPELWPRPRLMPLGILNDHQALAANWDVLGHVLVVAPLGQGASTALVALLAPLLARATPDELALQVIAATGSLPAELLAVPHLNGPVADPRRPESVQAALDRVQAELERRRSARANADGSSEPELILVVRELAELEPDAVAGLGPILLDGPRYGIRVLAAGERPAAELLHACPVLGEFGTRLVLQAADEDESVALLGVAGAETLGAGGRMLVRLDGRLPVQVDGYRVPPDRLARLVELMGGVQLPTALPPRPARVRPEPVDEPLPPTDPERTDEPSAWTPSVEEEGVLLEQDAICAQPIQASDAAATASAEPGGTRDAATRAPTPEDSVRHPVPVPSEPAGVHRNGTALGHAPARPALPRSDLLERLEVAPFRVSCFGARAVQHVPSGQLVYPAPGCPDKPFELLFLVAAHRLAGVRGELVVDSLWPNGLPKEPATELRKLRFRLREHLKRLAPDLAGDPIPNGSPKEPLEMDPSLVASDAHRFVELLRLARAAPREQAIAGYEAAISLYGGDLLDRADVPLWWWLYDGPEVASALRAEYRQLHQEARRQLADLYAGGEDDDELRRAQELYIGLAGELAEDERLWAALFRTHGRRGDRLGLEASIRRLRSALAEMAEDGEGPDAIGMPAGLSRLIDDVRVELVTSGRSAGDAPTR